MLKLQRILTDTNTFFAYNSVMENIVITKCRCDESVTFKEVKTIAEKVGQLSFFFHSPDSNVKKSLCA